MKATVESEQAKQRGDGSAASDREGSSSAAVPAAYLQRLQRAIGNHGVQRIVSSRLASGSNVPFGHHLGDVRQVPVRRRSTAIQRDDDQGTAEDGSVTIEEPGSDPYDVSGTTLAEVHPQLDPTEWGRCTYHYDYDYGTTNGRVTRVDITLRMTIRLPRWQEGRDEASPEARAEWDRMMAALRAHEERHAEIAREWAPRFKQRMLGVRARNATATYNQVKREADAAQRQYDTDTQHGQTEGVSLDLSIDQEQSPEAGETEAEVGAEE
jgi:predicted secreted Zn-dependent protease